MNKINLKYPQLPIEVFFKKAIQRYTTRGKIYFFGAPVFNLPLTKSDEKLAFFRLSVYALVNTKYLKNIRTCKIDSDNSILSFVGSSPKTYVKDIRSIIELKAEQSSKMFIKSLYEKALKDIPQSIKKEWPIFINVFNKNKIKKLPKLIDKELKFNPPFTLNKIEITKTKELNKAIKAKKDIILLGIFLDFDTALNPLTKQPIVDCKISSYHMLACLLADPIKLYGDQRHESALRTFEFFYEELEKAFSELQNTKQHFIELLIKLANLSHEWIEKKRADNNLISKLNAFFDSIKDSEDPLDSFFLSIYFDLTDNMLDANALNECAFCARLFPFHSKKQYCSKKSEGRDCRKAAANHRGYKKNKHKILPRNKEDVRKYRKLLKSHGITKNAQ